MSSITLEEKRLKQLKQQLFGKEKSSFAQAQRTKSQDTNEQSLRSADLKFQITKVAQNSKESNTQTTLIDPDTIKSDLRKIILFSLAALAIQLSLFFATRLGLINLFR